MYIIFCFHLSYCLCDADEVKIIYVMYISLLNPANLHKQMNKIGMNFEFRPVAFAFLIACVIWVISSGNAVLGRAAMVSVIVASATYHRVAGIIAVIVAIAFMQTQTRTQKEGFSMNDLNDHPLIPASTLNPLHFESAAEFRDKFCMKGVAQSDGNEPTVLQYMLSPALFDVSNDKPQFKLDVIKQMNVPSLNAANSCKPDPANGSNYASIANMCDPACNWTTNPTTALTPAPTPTEGFTPMLRPHIRTARHVVSNGIDNLKSTANRLKRQFF